MGFYDLTKEEREKRVNEIRAGIEQELTKKSHPRTLGWFTNEDTYIRKSAYLFIGRLYSENKQMRSGIVQRLDRMLNEEYFRARQTAINAAGEIGKRDFSVVQHIFEVGLLDVHHSPRNAVIGSIKKMGEMNPKPVLKWAKKYLHHKDKEIRREICHGIELRGRKYPQDILPLLQELENDTTERVRSTLVHVLGQIAYKKNCLQTVIAHLTGWKNKDIVKKALVEIIDVHERYSHFAHMSQKEARSYIEKNNPLK